MTGEGDDHLAETITGLYQDNAAAYDRVRGRTLFEKAWLDRFCDAIAAPTTILDLGCGAGEPVAAYLISRGAQITGIDTAPAMIEICRNRFPAHRWQVGDMRRLDLGERFGGIIAFNSFFHLTRDDQRAMFARLAGHCRPGGALLFTSGPGDGVAIGEIFGKRLYHASLAPEDYRALLTENGFKVIAHRAQDPECNGHTLWLCRRIDDP